MGVLRARLGSPRLPTLLVASAVGVYLLVVAGATASIADAVRACSTWPACGTPTLSDPSLLIAWGHRLLALVVGGLVVWTAVRVLRADVRRAVRASVLVALALYPVQIGLGAVVATSGGSDPFPAVHLATGLGLFGALVSALAWQLEAETGDPTDGPIDRGSDGDGQVTGNGGVPDDGRAIDDGPQGTPGPALAEMAPARRAVATVRAYVRLTKPRLMWLLCLVAAAGMALAAGGGLGSGSGQLGPGTIVLTLGGGVLAIGASGTFNHVLERDVDKRMERTADRPVATHEIPVHRALAFGATLTVASLALFLQVNVLAATLGLVAIGFYSVVYTVVLKPNTVQNTVIGGFAGSLPALIGWAAVTETVGLGGLALAGVIFLWTPAHFYNLALAYKEDYARGGFPMMPVVRGETETRKHIVGYLGATLIAAGGMAALTPLGPLYAITTTAFGAVFLWTVVRLHRKRTEAAAFRAFHASNAYLGALLLAVVVDSLAL